MFAATLKSTVPGPDPDAPLVIVIQVRFVDAVQAQPAPAVTVLLPVPAVEEKDWLVGEIEYEHGADCVTSNVVPAMVRVPERLAVPVFAATLKPTVPGPVPVAPLVTEIHAALLAAVHAHPAPAVTVLPPVPAAAVNAWLVGEIE